MHQTITRDDTRRATGPNPAAGSAGATQVVPSVQPGASTGAVLAPAAPRPRYAESARSMAGVALLLGVAGLFFFNIVLGPLAIGVGAAAMRRRSASARTRAVALAGLAFGVADLILLAVLVGVSLAHGGINWHFGA